MREPKYYSDFILGDRRLSSFNGIRYNEGDEITYQSIPTPKHITQEVSGMNGSFYFKSTYDSRLITIPIFIYDEIDIDYFNGWIGDIDSGLRPLTFIYENGTQSDRYLEVIYNKGVDFTSYYTPKFKGTSTLEFIAFDPLYKIKNEEKITLNSPVINKNYTFASKSNIKSPPIIKISPNGTQTQIKFMINDLTITLNNVNTPIIINAEDGEVYTMNNGIRVNAFQKYISDGWRHLPSILASQTNKFVLLSGNITSVEINRNTRIL